MLPRTMSTTPPAAAAAAPAALTEDEVRRRLETLESTNTRLVSELDRAHHLVGLLQAQLVSSNDRGERITKEPGEFDGVDYNWGDWHLVFGSFVALKYPTIKTEMEAAAEKGIDFIVLDRPNPVTGNYIEGPPIIKKWQSFVGQLSIPFRHGLTVGEIAKMAIMSVTRYIKGPSS